MNYKYVIDSYAWIEYFKGSKSGEKVKKFIEKNLCITPSVVIAELSAKYHRENWTFWEEDYQFILANSLIVDLTHEIAKLAGKTRQEMRKFVKDFGLVDAIILETARVNNLKVITGDRHFKEVKDTVFIGE